MLLHCCLFKQITSSDNYSYNFKKIEAAKQISYNLFHLENLGYQNAFTVNVQAFKPAAFKQCLYTFTWM